MTSRKSLQFISFGENSIIYIIIKYIIYRDRNLLPGYGDNSWSIIDQMKSFHVKHWWWRL